MIPHVSATKRKNIEAAINAVLRDSRDLCPGSGNKMMTIQHDPLTNMPIVCNGAYAVTPRLYSPVAWEAFKAFPQTVGAESVKVGKIVTDHYAEYLTGPKLADADPDGWELFIWEHIDKYIMLYEDAEAKEEYFLPVEFFGKVFNAYRLRAFARLVKVLDAASSWRYLGPSSFIAHPCKYAPLMVETESVRGFLLPINSEITTGLHDQHNIFIEAMKTSNLK